MTTQQERRAWWTRERIDDLTHLWDIDKLSSSAIARQMGTTKNAVVSKAHRIGCEPRPSPIRRVP